MKRRCSCKWWPGDGDGHRALICPNRLWPRGGSHKPESMTRIEAWVDSLEAGPNMGSSSPTASWSRQLASKSVILPALPNSRLSMPPALFLVRKSVHKRIRIDMAPSVLFNNDIGLLESALQLLATQTKVNRDDKPAILRQRYLRWSWEPVTACLQNKRQVFAMSSSLCFTWW